GDLLGAVVEVEYEGKPGARLLHLSPDQFISTVTVGSDPGVEGYFGSVSTRIPASKLATLAKLRLVRLHNLLPTPAPDARPQAEIADQNRDSTVLGCDEMTK